MPPDPKEILDNLYDGVHCRGSQRRITYWNKGAERISGHSAGDVVGHFCQNNILNHVTENGMQLCFNGCPLLATMQDGRPREAELYLHHINGQRVPVLVRTAAMIGEDGQIIGGTEIFSDNSSLLSAKRRIRKLQTTVFLDSLTGIANRRYLEIKLKSALSEFQQNRLPAGIVFIDIDHFKRVNDTYGHTTGDKVLRMVAKTISHGVRSGDIVARWGGEEFIVLLGGVGYQDLIDIAKKLRTLVENSHLTKKNQQIQVTISIGATLIRQEDDLESLVTRADQYMYNSKNIGRNRITTDGLSQEQKEP